MLPFPYTNALQSKQQALAHIDSRSTIVRLYLSLYLSRISYLELYRGDKHLKVLLFNDACISQRHLVT